MKNTILKIGKKCYNDQKTSLIKFLIKGTSVTAK